MFIAIIGTYEIQNRYLPDTNRPAFHLGLAIGQIYRHTYMYSEFCKAHGYEMVHYPKKVREKFTEEIKIVEDDQMALLSNALPNVYKNIEEFYSYSDRRSQEERFSKVSYLFERLRLHLIENQVAKEQNIDVRKVKLTEKDNERVSLKDACEVFDNDAEWFTSSDAPFNYILNYVRNYANCGTYYNTIGKVE